MESKIWGPPTWFFLHSITFNYPNNPTYKEKMKTFDFFNNLQYILPCEIFRENYNVTDVLFVGKSARYKSLTKYFSQDSRFGVIFHPSRRVGRKGNWFYDTLDSSAIDEVSYYRKKYQKTSFSSFSISLFSDTK